MRFDAPSLETTLPHRTSPFVPGTRLGRVLDFVTATWFRFNICITWLAVVLSIAVSPGLSFGTKLLAILVSPAAGLLAYLLLSALVGLCAFLPILKYPMGFLRIGYMTAFSRLVGQPIKVSWPAWY